MEAYRGWYIQKGSNVGEPDKTYLTSTNIEHVWKSSEFKASCHHGCNVGICLREHICGCGVYSKKDLSSLLNEFGFLAIYGIVENYGMVLEGETGYRSEFSQVRALYTADIALGKQLKEAYPDVAIMMPPEELVLAMKKNQEYRLGNLSWQKRFARIDARRKATEEAVEAAKAKYPEGPEAEKKRLLGLLRNANRAEIVAFAKEYASDSDWLERNWLAKGENSRKAKPGDIVFEANNTIQPYVFIGSTRQPSGQSSVRYLLGRNGFLFKRMNIRRWDEEEDFLEERKKAIDEWE